MNSLITLLLACLSFFQTEPTQKKESKIQLSEREKTLPTPSNCIASPDPMIVSQSNGTTLTIVGRGNMNNSWTETVDGYTVVKNQNGIYEYAEKVNGTFQASGIIAHDVSTRTTTETAFLGSVQKSIQPPKTPFKSSILNQVRKGVQNKTYPTSGSINVLALLIEYPDLNNTFPKANFDSLLYGSNYRNGDGSFKVFYETSTNNQLTINVDVRGWFMANNSYLYYGRDSGSARAADLVREAVDAAEVAGVNFANYDNDNDGDVDGILAVHAGQGAEQGSRTEYIWSHRWVLNGGTMGSAIYDGVRINDYMINPETRVSGTNQNMVGIGVFCHEFGHNLGLPDLYDTDDSNGDSEGIGTWCLMSGGSWAGGEHRPTNFSAWCKEESGWITPTQLTIGTSSSHTLNPSSTNINEVYRINTNQPSEYFLVENRQRVGLDQSLSGEGLAIWHINTNKTNSFGNSVNADENLKGVDLEAADGLNDMDNEVNRGDAGDLFPGNSNNTRFDDSSNPSAQNYNSSNTGLIIRNITESGTQVSFDFGSGAAPGCSGNTNLFNTSGTFDDGSPASSNYDNNLNCSWTIQPTGATSITLNFNRFDVHSTIDRVAVYDGNSFTAPLIGTYTGNSIPPTINSSGGALYLEFTTNSSATATGWEASYTSSSGTSCSGTTTLTASSGTFSDGSGSSNYANNLNCSWLIQPTGASTITFGLSSLATEISTDWIRVYDGSSSSSPLLGSYSGTNNLNTLTSSGGSIFVEFTTNSSGTDAGWDAFYTSSSSGPGCSGNTNLTASSGSFSDGSGTSNYDNNQFCSWLIQPSSGASSITLSFSNFSTEPTSDRVIIYDGTSATAPQLASYSGSNLPANVTSSGGAMYIEFRTNGTVTDQGWDASYTSTTPTSSCSGLTTLTAASGSFDDGSGTANYSNNLSCGWLIQPTGSPASITLTANSMNLVGFGDRLRVYDGTNSSAPLVGSFLFNGVGSVTAYSGSMYLEFTTDANNTAQGWDVSYTSSSTFCQALTNFTNTFGNFTDGSPLGQNYANNSNCSWLIQPTNPNLAIVLDLFRLDTEFGVDTVTIYDGATTSDPILGTFSGSTAPSNNIISSGNAMLITFISDGNTTASGWGASYFTQPIPACSGQTTLTAATGTFDDGSGNGNLYTANSNCTWLIQPTGAISIDLSFNYFSTESNFDLVTIYDGSTTSAPVLGTFSGSSIPPNLTGGGSMLVEFTSDGSAQSNGFEINYTSSNIVSLDIVEDTVYINSGIGNSVTVDVTSNTTWTINESSPWLISTTNSGSQNQTINLLTTQPNIGPPRSTFVYANNNSSPAEDSVLVIQRGSGNYLITNPDTLFYTVAGGTQKFEVLANVNWTVNIPTGPGTANPTNGSSDDSVAVTLPTNGSSGIQYYMAVVSSSAPNTSNDTVILAQSATAPSLSVTPVNLTLNQAGGSSGSFTVNSTVVWQTSSPASWLTITNPAVTADTNTVQIMANSMNMSTNNRDSYIAVQDVAGTLFDTVFVTQLGGNIFLSASPKNVSLAQAANSFANSTLTSNVSWNATSSDPSWLSVNPTNGMGNAPLNITALTTNTSTNVRSGYIALASTNGNLVDTIFVDQDGYTPQLSVDPSAISLAQTNGSMNNFQINSNVSWQTTGGASWITVLNPAVTQDTNTVQLMANSANTTPNPRSTFVAVMDINGTLFDTVEVTQLGTNPILTGSPDTVILASNNGSTATISLTSNINWTATEGANWFSANQSSGTASSTITLTSSSSNNSGSERISIIDFAEQGGGLTDTVVVIQETAPSIPTTNPDTIRLNAATNSSATYNIVSPSLTLMWNTSPIDNWLSLSQTSGSGNATITATANSANTSFSDRMTYVLTTATSLPIGIDTLVVIQEGINPNLNISPSVLNLNFASGSNDVLTINSNVNWTVTNPSTWLSLSSNSGSGNASITATANSDNLSGSNRSTTLTFSGAGVPDQLVTVSQIDGSTPSFNISKDTVFVSNPQGSTGTFSILANTVNWSLSESTSWLLINPTTGNNTQTITALVASRNVFGNPRYADILVSANGYPDDTVTVVQEAATPLFQVSPSMLILGSDSLDYADFNISSNLISWKVTENAPWMQVTPDSGAFTSQIRITATQTNRSGNVRTDIISIEAPPLVPQTISVTQDTIRTIGIEESILASDFNVFPNPTGNELNVVFPDSINTGDVQMAIFNTLGARVNLVESKASMNQVRFDVSSLAPGFYFISIDYKGKRITKKISIIDQ